MNRRSIFALAAAAVAGLSVATYTYAAGHDFPAGSPKFETKYKSALAEAKKTGKPIIAVFSATWCGPCQNAKKTVYPSEAVKPYHDKFVWVYLDVDEAGNKKAAEEYGVSSIPHIQFISKDGKALSKQVGAPSPEGFAKLLEGVLAKAGPATPSAPEKSSGLQPRKTTAATEKKQ
jgi:thiol:disulfide interchange protein